MLSKNQSPGRRGRLSATLQLLTAALFLCVAAVTPATAQYEVHYSDQWADDSVEETLNAVGAGVTEADYTSDADSYTVQTTLQGPSGQTFTVTVDGYSYTRAEVSTVWDLTYGTWFVYTSHWGWYFYDCWDYGYRDYYYDYGYYYPYQRCGWNRHLLSRRSLGLDWFDGGSDHLEYWNDDPNPVVAGGFDSGRYCSYQICGWHYNNECARGRRAVLRNDGRTGTAPCVKGMSRSFLLVGVGPVKYCREIGRPNFFDYDPCEFNHRP